jgi:hypothetical protein
LAPFTSQNLSILLWSYSTLKTPVDDLFTVVSQEVIRRSQTDEGLAAFTAQNLTLLLWSTASTRQSQPDLIQKVSHEILERAATSEGLTTFNVQNLGNILWSLATLHSKESPLIAAVKSELLERYKQGTLRYVTPQHLSNMAWSLASLEDRSDELMKSIQSEVMHRANQGTITHFTPPDFSNLARGYSVVGVGSTEDFRVLICAAVQKGLESHTAQGLLMFLWSVIKSAQLPKDEMNAFFADVQRVFLAKERSITDLVFFLWCSAIQGSLHASQFNPLLQRIAKAELGTTEKRQLLQVRLACQVAERSDILWPPDLTASLDQFLKDEPSPQSSAFHQEVARTVDAILVAEGRPRTVVEGRVEIYFVDLLTPDLVIQVNGPHHRHGDAIEEFRDRQLASLGYPVKKVWWDQWQQLRTSERFEYCRKMLGLVP